MMYCDFDDRRVGRANETMAEVSSVLLQERMAVSGCGVVMRRSNNSNPTLSQPGQDTFSRMYERSTENTRSNTNNNINTSTNTAPAPAHRGGESDSLSLSLSRVDLSERRQHLAANVIQKAYRSHVFNKSFLDLRNRQRVVGEMYSDTDGTLTLTPHRAAEWHATYPHNHEHETDCGARMRLEISPSSVAQVNDGAQLRHALALNGAPDSASPVWIRQLDGDAFHFDDDEEELSSAATLRAGNRSEASLQEAAVKERGFSMDVRPAGSHNCECEECRMSKRVAQLSVVFFGSDSDRAARSSAPSVNTTAGNGRPVAALPATARATVSTGTLRPAAVAAAVKRHEIDKRRKQLYRVGLNLFNRQPEGGVQFLIAAGFVKPEPSSIAHFLLARHGLSRSAIGELLGAALRNATISEVLAAVAAQHCFADRPIDVALRSFQSGFQLTGEAQRIQRVVEAFAEQYTVQNEKLLRVKFRTQKRADLVHLLALACLMLNTDLHSPNVRADRKMKPEEFVRNLSGLDDGADLDRTTLLEIYERVRAKPFATARDHVAHVRKLETVLIGLSAARPLSLTAADMRQRRKSSSTLLNRQPIRQSSDAGSIDMLSDSSSRPGFVYRFDFSKLALPYRRIVCYCRVFELAESQVRKLFSTGVLHLEVADGGRVQSRIVQPQPIVCCEDDKAHEQSESQRREVFLFNDSLLITKQNSRSKTKKSGDKPRPTSYAFRQIVSLANAHVSPYCSAQTPFGVCIVAPACDVHCAKNATDLYIANVGEPMERGRGLWQDSSSNSSSHSNLSDRTAAGAGVGAGLQDIAVLILSAKSSADCEKFCEDIVESIIETRTMRRVLSRLADGVAPADIARAYVPATVATPTLSASPSLTAAIDASINTRRGSEPIIPMPNSNSVDQPAVVTPQVTNTRWTTADTPVARQAKLSVSSTSSSSIGTMGTMSGTSYDDASNRSTTSRSQTHLAQQRLQTPTQRHTLVDSSLMQKQTLLVTPEKAHVLTAADVQQLLRTGSPHQAHAPSTPSPLALTPGEQSDVRRSLQFGNKPSYTSGAPRPLADIDATVAENSDYLTLGSVPIVRR